MYIMPVILIIGMLRHLKKLKKIVKYEARTGKFKINDDKIIKLCFEFLYKHMLKLISLVLGLFLAWTAYSQLPLVSLTQS